MKVLKIDAKPLEPIRLTDDDWLRLVWAALTAGGGIESFCV